MGDSGALDIWSCDLEGGSRCWVCVQRILHGEGRERPEAQAQAQGQGCQGATAQAHHTTGLSFRFLPLSRNEVKQTVSDVERR